MTQLSSNHISEQTLDKAMLLFWEKGYFNTSVEDIVGVTGVNRATLYKNFDGKQGLFLAMLRRFRSNVIQSATDSLQDPSRGIEAIHFFFNQFFHADCQMMSSHGCFIIATATDIPSHDDEVTELIHDFINHLRTLFLDIFIHLKSQKQIDQGEDPKALADFLVCNVLGLVTLFRSGADQTIARRHVQTVNRFLVNLRQENPNREVINTTKGVSHD